MQKLNSVQLRFLIIRTVGNFLVLGSIFGMFLTFGPAVKNEISYRYDKLKGISYVVSATSVESSGEPTPTPAPTEKPQQGFFRDILGNKPEILTLTPVDTEFGIIIPKIAANAKIIPNVDSNNHEAYLEALKEGVAQAQGTNFPGQGGNIYLFAHSTDNFWNVGRYNAVFYLLKELEKGDEVDLFYQGRRYIYSVSEKTIVDPLDVSLINNPAAGEQVTLQTCWPPGTTWKRLFVIAKPLTK